MRPVKSERRPQSKVPCIYTPKGISVDLNPTSLLTVCLSYYFSVAVNPLIEIGISQGRPPQYQIREKTREGQARPRSMNKRAYIPENYGADHYEEEIKNLEAEITGLWETHNVPQFHR